MIKQTFGLYVAFGMLVTQMPLFLAFGIVSLGNKNFLLMILCFNCAALCLIGALAIGMMLP